MQHFLIKLVKIFKYQEFSDFFDKKAMFNINIKTQRSIKYEQTNKNRVNSSC